MWKSALLYLVLEVFILVACNTLDDTCSFADSSEAVIGELNARNIRYNSYDNIALLASEDTVERDKHVLWLEVDPEYLGYNNTGSWPGRAMACTVAPELKTEIRSINVRRVSAASSSTNSSDEESLNEYFSFYTRENEKIPISNLDYLNQQFKSSFYLFLAPSESLETLENYAQYHVDVVTTDGVLYSLTTEKVYLK